MVEAHGGTLFLDEIGELPKDLQPKLLRALDKKQVRPLGSDKTFSVDVRVIAATNRDLKLDVNRGLFREDLFYRLNVISIRVPPLRDRPEDVELLANHFWRLFTRNADGAVPPEILATLLRHRWPGNVRELRNRVEQAVVLGRAPDFTNPQAARIAAYHQAKQQALDEFERRFLSELMLLAKGNVSEAARLATMDRVNLSKLLRKHGLHRPLSSA
jgi:DNA-binding NtrC family response regulator